MTAWTDDIIKGLREGNLRYVLSRGRELAKHVPGQKPEVAILTCSDSRVIPEYIFDRSLGEIFIVRVAGNVACDPSVIFSLEYAVEHLKARLIVVLGHTNCGAVRAAAEQGEGAVVDEIRKSFPLHREHFRANVMRQTGKLAERSQVISEAVKNGKLAIIGAVYHLESGIVEFLQ